MQIEREFDEEEKARAEAAKIAAQNENGNGENVPVIVGPGRKTSSRSSSRGSSARSTVKNKTRKTSAKQQSVKMGGSRPHSRSHSRPPSALSSHSRTSSATSRVDPAELIAGPLASSQRKHSTPKKKQRPVGAGKGLAKPTSARDKATPKKYAVHFRIAWSWFLFSSRGVRCLNFLIHTTPLLIQDGI